jgi:heme-degrading monooxygenase HmoA
VRHDGTVYLRIWKYDVDASRAADFEDAYGPDGAWAQLFSGCDGFLGTELFARVDEPGRYLTVDRFTSAAAWQNFLAELGEAYAELDRRTEGITLDERELASVTLEDP